MTVQPNVIAPYTLKSRSDAQRVAERFFIARPASGWLTTTLRVLSVPTIQVHASTESDIASSGTSAACKVGAMQILQLCRAARVRLAESVTATDDGGLLVEFESASSSRELLFTVSDEGDARFFTTLDEAGTRRSGIASLRAVQHLARWTADASQPFPSSGIVLG